MRSPLIVRWREMAARRATVAVGGVGGGGERERAVGGETVASLRAEHACACGRDGAARLRALLVAFVDFSPSSLPTPLAAPFFPHRSLARSRELLPLLESV